MLCDRVDGELTYYQKASSGEVAQCVQCGDTLAQTVGLYVAGAACVALLGLLLRLYVQRIMSSETKRKVQRFNTTFTPRNKLKVIVGCYQLCTKVDTVYDVSLPPDVKGVLEHISGFISLGVNGVATTSLECMGLSGYRSRLLFWMTLPAVIIFLVALVVDLVDRP